ncbi:MAG: hypothetical protein ACYSUP_14390 [Planctomycetota bacterium]|jgi:hypothetical protein
MLGKVKLKTLIIILAPVSVILLVGILVRRKLYSPFAWGKGNLTVSERTYCKDGFERIIREWRRRPARMERDSNGVPTLDYNVYLVIDTTKPGIWLEDNGVVQLEYCMDLPEGMKWAFYRCIPSGNEHLPTKVRLKIRCRYWNRIYPEKIFLQGYGRGNKYLSFWITSGRGRFDYGDGRRGIQESWGKYEKDKDYYDSIFVSDTEYSHFLESIRTDEFSSQSVERHKETENEEVRRWMTIEKQFYQEIEKQVSLKGHVLKKLEVSCGGDHMRAFAMKSLWFLIVGILGLFEKRNAILRLIISKTISGMQKVHQLFNGITVNVFSTLNFLFMEERICQNRNVRSGSKRVEKNILLLRIQHQSGKRL